MALPAQPAAQPWRLRAAARPASLPRLGPFAQTATPPRRQEGGCCSKATPPDVPIWVKEAPFVGRVRALGYSA